MSEDDPSTPSALPPSWARDHLANERTLLAWIRTALGFMAFGVTVAKLGVLVRAVGLEHPEIAGELPSSARSDAMGITLIVVGVVFGVALSPLSTDVQRRFGRSRIAAAGIVGLSLGLLFAAVLVLVAPAAVEQASDFSEELPATVEELYSWPIIGNRLEDADAAEEVEDAIADLPARVDDETLAQLGERLLGGAFWHLPWLSLLGFAAAALGLALAIRAGALRIALSVRRWMQRLTRR